MESTPISLFAFFLGFLLGRQSNDLILGYMHACMQQIASVQFFDIIDWFLSQILSLILLLFSVLHNFEGMHDTILAGFLVYSYTNQVVLALLLISFVVDIKAMSMLFLLT